MIYLVNDLRQDHNPVAEYRDEAAAREHEARLLKETKLVTVLWIQEDDDVLEPDPESWVKVEHHDIFGRELNTSTDMIIVKATEGSPRITFLAPMNEAARRLKDDVDFGDVVQIEKNKGYRWQDGDDPDFNEDDDERCFLNFVFELRAQSGRALFVAIC